MRPAYWLCLAVASIALPACSGPVRATGCSIHREGLHHALVMHASLYNTTSKPLHHVGVLAGPMEFEFNVRLEAYGSSEHATGTPYDAAFLKMYPNYDWHRESGCWARSVEFDDGSVWSVSPL